NKGPLMGSTVDSRGNIYMDWMLTGAISKYDPTTRKATTFRIPTPGAVPYGQAIDPFDNVWVSEWNGGKLGRFNTKTNTWTEFTPRDQTFTFYPRPQFAADSTRVNHAEDGSVHYTARYGSAKDTSAFGVLYPDKDKITTLAPRMLNGAPGYSFKVGSNEAR